ncbi:cupin domain-containing protein [Rhodohalobacter sp.]|uniref:cupin domain-containing protein n=1 Tax=Rhodohalobacter sp. TaxID=1974210 RepID=UPI003569ECD3
MKRERKPLSKKEKSELDNLLDSILDPTLFHYGSERREVARYDKRDNMYGGSGTVYLLQMFSKGELVNNRIGAYMILPEKGDSVGLHTHGTRKEQELYVVVHGEGIYSEKDSEAGKVRNYDIKKGSVTTVRGEAYHAVKNSGNEPLVIFVITTNEPE